MPAFKLYILRQLIAPFLLVTVGLTAIVWLTQSLRFLDLMVNKGLSIVAFGYLTLLVLPTFLGAILPIALFCALLFAYNKLTVDSELVSLRASGVSQWGLAAPALMLAGVVCLASYAITMYFVPNSFREFKERQFVLRSDYSSILIQEGVFNNVLDNLTVYVRTRDSAGVLKGILVHDTSNAEQPVTMMAEEGILVNTEEGPRFILLKGNRQEINKDRTHLSLLYFDRYTLDLSQFTEQRGERWRKAGERYIHELFFPGDSPGEQANRYKFLAEAHNRIVSPLFTFGLTMIALAALLSGDFNRRGQWRRILTAIIAAFAFEAAGLALVNVVAKQPGLTPLMYVNVAAAIGGGALLLNRRATLWRFGRRATTQPTP